MTVMRRPRLKTTLECFVAADGTLYLLRPGAADDLVIREPSAAQVRLFARLARPVTPEALEADFGGELAVGEALDQLGGLGLLEDTADDELLAPLDRERYDRQLAYFAEIGVPGTSAARCQRRLAQSRVVIVGVGGLGGWAALALACTGVGRLDLVDGDTVELSNLNRQVVYGPADLGRPKALAAADALRRFNPGLECRATERRVESADEVAALIEGADVLVGTADWPPFAIGHWLNEAAFAAGIPWISASQFPPLVRVGPTYVPGRTGCLACQHEAWREEHPLIDELAAAGRLDSSVAASFGPACGLVGSLLAADVVHLLTGVAEPATLGSALLVDLRTAAVEREAVPLRAGCPVCATAPGSGSPVSSSLSSPASPSRSASSKVKRICASLLCE